MTHDLSGLLVVSLEQAVAAPVLLRVSLADAGARVIKVERPEAAISPALRRRVNG